MNPNASLQTDSLQTDTSLGLSWFAIVRLGLVQAALGSIVVLMTSTLNRVMVVELSLAASIPAALVGLHYAVQLLRPLWGHGSDAGRSRTRWILGGMGLLCASGALAAVAVGMMANSFALGLALALLAFAAIGFGIGAAGTSMLALLAARTAPERRPAAATLVWTLMILGIVVTAGVTGALLDPFSFERLSTITAATGLIAFVVTLVATWGIEHGGEDYAAPRVQPRVQHPPFRDALLEAWNDDERRLFTLFVFVSMLAYSAQDLILEPFGGLIHGMTPGETTALSGTQHGGVLLGMILVGTLGTWAGRRWPGTLRLVTVSGCAISAFMLGALALSTNAPGTWPIGVNVFALGLSNGAFAVAAIGSMMALAAKGPGGATRAGVRMGVWGAAQAVAFGLGNVVGAVAVDVMGTLTNDVAASYRIVFLGEGVVFLLAAMIATRLDLGSNAPRLTAPEADLAAMRFEPGGTPLEPAE